MSSKQQIECSFCFFTLSLFYVGHPVRHSRNHLACRCSRRRNLSYFRFCRGCVLTLNYLYFWFIYHYLYPPWKPDIGIMQIWLWEFCVLQTVRLRTLLSGCSINFFISNKNLDLASSSRAKGGSLADGTPIAIFMIDDLLKPIDYLPCLRIAVRRLSANSWQRDSKLRRSIIGDRLVYFLADLSVDPVIWTSESE